MNGLTARVRRFLISEDGPTAIEYAVMAVLIVVVCVAIIRTLGSLVTSDFNSVSPAFSS